VDADPSAGSGQVLDDCRADLDEFVDVKIEVEKAKFSE